MMNTKENWFEIRGVDAGIYEIREPGHVQCFLVIGKDKSALIDTGMGFCDLKPLVSRLTETPTIVLNTHWHFDHIGGNAVFENIGISKVEEKLLTRPISNSELMQAYIDDCIRMRMPLPERFIPAQYAIHSPVQKGQVCP